MVDFYGKLVGKYTGPMDPSWVIQPTMFGENAHHPWVPLEISVSSGHVFTLTSS